MGARSEIPTEVTRDFRRSGTSHQMAVSGMHITILLGSIELLLRKLRVGKTARCIAVSFLSVGFLFLTGFSLSACRSVLMLYAVYISYMFHEDHDALTALFVSITVILLVSPYSVNDLGMWMSFLATLGVLTVYALCEKSIPYPKSKKPWKRKILRLGRSILLGALMTVIANLFLLLVVWLIFGELSLVAVMSNLVLTVPAYLFLVGAALLLLFGSVPLLGAVIGWVVSWIASVILSIVSTFSLLPYATVSLNYGFAGIIIVLFSITWAIFLVIRLPKRWLLSLPPVAAVLAFVICLSIYQAVNYAPTLIYSYSRDQELIGVREGNTVSFCDLSSGSGGFSMLYEEMTDAHATEIHTLVLTHYHEEHCSMISLCTKELVLRKLYLPVPEDREEALISKELWEMAVDGGAEVIFYNGNEILQLTDSVRAKVNTVTENSCPATLLSLYSKDCAYTYLSPAIWGGTYEEAARNRMLRSRAVIFGSHGAADAPRYFFDLTESETPEYIVYTSEPILRASGCRTEGAVILAPSETEPYRLRFSFSSSH